MTSPAVSQVVQEGKMVVVPKNPKKIASNSKPKPNPSKCKVVLGVGGLLSRKIETLSLSLTLTHLPVRSCRGVGLTSWKGIPPYVDCRHKTGISPLWADVILRDTPSVGCRHKRGYPLCWLTS